MVDVVNIIREVMDRRYAQRGEPPWGLMVHRCGVDLQTGAVLGYDGKSVADAFCGRVPEWAEAAKATGGENAYSLLIGGDLGPPEFDGVAWQTLALDETGPHGRRFSSGFIGIGCIFDGREKAMSRRQNVTLVDVCAAFCDGYGWDPPKRIFGHGEIRGAHGGEKASGQPAACPGDLLDMAGLRFEVGAMVDHHRRARLAQQMQFTR